MKRLNILLVPALGAALLLSGCVEHDRVVYHDSAPYPPPHEIIVNAPPPPPPREVVVYSPGPGYVWIRGAWAWRDGWVWEPGHWARPPRPGYYWRPHHYEYRNGVHVFVSGSWTV